MFGWAIGGGIVGLVYCLFSGDWDNWIIVIIMGAAVAIAFRKWIFRTFWN